MPDSQPEDRLSSARAADRPLFTPGPVTTSATVKAAMLRDLGSRDVEFRETVRRIRDTLLELGGGSRAAGYEAVPLQGSGTFGLEAVFASGIEIALSAMTALTVLQGQGYALIAF